MGIMGAGILECTEKGLVLQQYVLENFGHIPPMAGSEPNRHDYPNSLSAGSGLSLRPCAQPARWIGGGTRM